MSEIEGSTALVTGGASGIGYRIGAALLRRGAHRLVVWDVDEAALSAAIDSLASEVAAAPDADAVDSATTGVRRSATAANGWASTDRWTSSGAGAGTNDGARVMVRE